MTIFLIVGLLLVLLVLLNAVRRAGVGPTDDDENLPSPKITDFWGP
jgi:hypothetical protein